MPRIMLLANFFCSTLTTFGESSHSTPSGRLDISIPLNEDVAGIRIPYYSESGRLEAQFDARLVRKIDTACAIFTDLVVHLLRENDHPFHIDISSGTLDLHSHVLSGHDGVILHHHDTCAVAKSVVFLLGERLVCLRGNVRVIVRNCGRPTGLVQTWR